MKLSEIKEAVRHRDGERCVRCGLTRQEHREWSEYAVEACITLCCRCHTRGHASIVCPDNASFIHISIDDRTALRLERLARASGRDVASLVGETINDALKLFLEKS